MNILEEIILNKQEENKNKASNGEKFKKVFSEKKASIIGEIKIASPKYDYSDNLDTDKVLAFYGEEREIKAISNLVDERYFKGNILRGPECKRQYSKPIFFKEFVINKSQIDGACYHGYDALLLLARCLNRNDLIELLFYTVNKNIFPIVEVDCEGDLKSVLSLSCELDFGIAINCRNLGTMEIDRKRHFKLEEKFRKDLENKVVFAFSGIDDVKQVDEYRGRFNGVLIGSYFMKILIENTNKDI